MNDVTTGQAALREMRIDDAVTAFQRALASDPENIAAHLGMYEALQVKGDPAAAVAHQRRALEQQQLFLDKPTPKGAPSILLVAIPGDWQANVPLEFLYSSLNVGVYKLFVGPGLPWPDPQGLPGDVIFNAVAQSDAADETLATLQSWLPKIGRPLLNSPAAVRKLSREGVARDFAGMNGALVPNVRRVKRESLGPGIELPAIVRPIASHAGSALGKIEGTDQWSSYLETTPATEFYVAPFIDYRSADGFFRKYRIIFVGGVPYAQHLAISDRWMIHYYNALNEREAWIRDEEARFLSDVFSAFDGPRRHVLEELGRRVGLDYFGIDCGIIPDGRVLFFEVDAAMIVHLGDSPELYPYKQRYVPRIPEALQKLIYGRLGRA